ncbi:Nuclear intron maturase 2 protein, partial [Thalictrum thalictroides]
MAMQRRVSPDPDDPASLMKEDGVAVCSTMWIENFREPDKTVNNLSEYLRRFELWVLAYQKVASDEIGTFMPRSAIQKSALEDLLALRIENFREPDKTVNNLSEYLRRFELWVLAYQKVASDEIGTFMPRSAIQKSALEDLLALRIENFREPDKTVNNLSEYLRRFELWVLAYQKVASDEIGTFMPRSAIQKSALEDLLALRIENFREPDKT